MLSQTICRARILERIQKRPFPQRSPETTLSDSATVEILRSRQESAPRDDHCFGDAVRRSQRSVSRAVQAPPLQPRIENMKRRSSQHLMGGAGLLDAKGDLVGDADAVAFEGDDFFRVIGEDANVLEAEVDQDLRADATFVLHHALARRFAIELAALMEMNLWENAGFFGGFNAEATSRVVQVEKDAAVFFGDSFQRARDEFVAVASGGTENVAGEAVRMDAHQG